MVLHLTHYNESMLSKWMQFHILNIFSNHHYYTYTVKPGWSENACLGFGTTKEKYLVHGIRYFHVIIHNIGHKWLWSNLDIIGGSKFFLRAGHLLKTDSKQISYGRIVIGYKLKIFACFGHLHLHSLTPWQGLVTSLLPY